MLLAHISHLYALSLTPIPPFLWLGTSISTLDVLAAIRLCSVMRQIREAIRQSQPDEEGQPEEHSFTKSISATWTVVYGGEVFTGGFHYYNKSSLTSSGDHSGLARPVPILPYLSIISIAIPRDAIYSRFASLDTYNNV